MKKEYHLLVVCLFMLVSMISLCSAYIVPDTHLYVSDAALEIASNSPYGKLASENREDFLACNFVTDYSVFSYLSQGLNKISVVYLASHNNLVCQRAMELADKTIPAQVSCAIGICSMDVEDSSSHNGYVPLIINRVGMPNSIMHALGEQCINEKVSTPQLNQEGRAALVNKYPVHRDFLIKVFQGESGSANVDVGKMLDAFVYEVAGSDTYSVGFRGFTAVPTSVHVVLMVYFLLGMLALAYLIKKKNKGIFNKISMFLLVILDIIPVILVYVLYFTGNIWRAFQYASSPICKVLPISGWETYVQQAISDEVKLLNQGAIYASQIADPSGQAALAAADHNVMWLTVIVIFILLCLISLFVWLNIRRKNGKTQNNQ